MKKLNIILFLLITALLQSCTKDNSVNNSGNGNNIIANQKALGTSSTDLLSDNTYTAMTIEIVYVDGFAPTQTAIDNFVSFIESRTYKPTGITVESRSIASLGNGQYSIQDIKVIEDANRTKYNSNNTIAVWGFFSDGESSSNTNDSVILGTAYRNTSFVIFEETIHDLSNSTFEPSRNVLETTVINHEFGHILGLTDLGAALQSDHEDPEHLNHCNVQDCLMYWSAETGEGLSNLMSGGTVPQLDPQCIMDLQANGGR